MPEEEDIPGRLLTVYWRWGLAATVAFLLFLGMLAFYYSSDYNNIFFLFGILSAGFLWIGATSFSRHSFMRLKEFMGTGVSLPEFVSTQLVVLLLPFSYFRLKKEVEVFRAKTGEMPGRPIRR